MGSFGHVQQEPLTAKQSNNHMSVYARCRVRWMDPGFYPVQEQLIAGVTISEDDVLLVDVAGSFGHDLSDFRRKWPGLPGRLVLQDLPEVMVSVKDLHPSIEVTSHDFFTERPVKGARAYYMHSVLHDWPDELCRKILANTMAAMPSGYSKVLVNETVIRHGGLLGNHKSGLDYDGAWIWRAYGTTMACIVRVCWTENCQDLDCPEGRGEFD